MEKDRVGKRLYQWLSMKEDVNSALLRRLINKKDVLDITKYEIDLIYPILLIEFPENDSGLIEAFSTLKQELRKSRSEEYQIMYLKSKLGLLSQDFILSKLQQIKASFCKELFYKLQFTFDTAYKILFFVENALATNMTLDCFLLDMLVALMVFYAKEYKMLEFSVLVEAFSKIVNRFPKDHSLETLNFLCDQQSRQGYFGFSDPFLVRMDGGDMVTTIHMYIAYRKLHDKIQQ